MRPFSFFPTRFIATAITVSILVLSTPCEAATLTSDSCSVTFQLNMTKMAQEQLFNPDSDYLWIIMDQGVDPLRLVPGPGYNYSCTLYTELDSGITYHYKFRINDTLWETVNRSITAKPGMVYVNAWWNNEALNYTRFTVNMQYAVESGIFLPGSDSVCIVGTMNDMMGSPAMQRVDTTLVYSYIYSLGPGSIHQYKYRINADSAGLELLNKPARIFRVPDTLISLPSDFNNYNPAKCLMTFRCNMGYYVKAHHFDPTSEFLDIAGNFNGWGDQDVLFDRAGDTVYTLDKYIDTTWFHTGPLLFKFRINGDWATSELSGKPERSYVFHDTINGNPDLFTCYYNNLDPHTLTPPWAYDVSIQGILIHKEIINGMYTYENINGIPEGNSIYQWYRSDDAIGTNLTPIDTAWRITYTIDTLDIGKWLVFEVTPKAAYGDSATGATVRVFSASSIGGVGIDELSLITRVYPNPATDYIVVEARKNIDRVEIFHPSGKIMMIIERPGTRTMRIPVNSFSSGLYFLRVTAAGGATGVTRFVR